MNNIKKKVKEKIKVYSDEKYLEGYIKTEFLTDDGKADIILNVNDKDELFDSKTRGNQLELCDDIYDYIDEKTSMLNNDVELDLDIMGIKLDNNDKERVKHLLNEHYAIELYKKQRKYKKCKKSILRLFIFGIIFLLAYTFIALHPNFDLFIEIFGFLFSFTLWQAFELLFFDLRDIKREREAITQKLIMNIYFEE